MAHRMIEMVAKVRSRSEEGVSDDPQADWIWNPIPAAERKDADAADPQLIEAGTQCELL